MDNVWEIQMTTEDILSKLTAQLRGEVKNLSLKRTKRDAGKLAMALKILGMISALKTQDELWPPITTNV